MLQIENFQFFILFYFEHFETQIKKRVLNDFRLLFQTQTRLNLWLFIIQRLSRTQNNTSQNRKSHKKPPRLKNSINTKVHSFNFIIYLNYYKIFMIVTNCFPTFFFLLLLCVLLYILTICEQHSLIENFFLAFSPNNETQKT